MVLFNLPSIQKSRVGALVSSMLTSEILTIALVVIK